eukprot:TRINITY_DN1528_c0_g1_i3.p1 TRINITY_DN1528_c0_g1~~TRINITY_DN1528_c0_g1_i3.p1  ORF type:complete len:368 (-),score=70.61 TRINITY_DN1528_c0_g1_i3:303-1370(-)
MFLCGLLGTIGIFVVVLLAFWLKSNHKPDVETFSSKSKAFVDRCDALKNYFPFIVGLNNHIHTCLFVFWRGKEFFWKVLKYKQELVPVDQGDVQLMWVESKEVLPENTPIVILLPGVVGVHIDNYLERLSLNLDKKRKWRCVVKSWRGLCAPLTAPFPETWDERSVQDLHLCLKTIKHKYPSAPIFCVGFSHGGSIVASYSGYYQEKSLIDGAVCVSPVLKPTQTLEHMNAYKPFPPGFYEFANIKNLLNETGPDNLELLANHLGKPELAKEILNISVMEECTKNYHAAMTINFTEHETAEDYFHSLDEFLGENAARLSVPTMIVISRDDPLFPENGVDQQMDIVRGNENAIIVR